MGSQVYTDFAMAWPFHRGRLRMSLAALCLLLAWILPNAALFLSVDADTCACGMKRGCICKLIAREGAHCDKKGGGCSMRRAHRPDAAPLLASLDLRGWLRGDAGLAIPGTEPAGTLAVGAFPLPPAPAQFPATPPPRLLPYV